MRLNFNYIKKMDLETIIIGLASLALCIVPIFYFQSKQKAKKEKLLQEFMKLAQQHQLMVTQYDFWDPSYAIGIDTAKKILLYTRKGAEKDDVMLIDLSDVQQCKVNNLYRDSVGGRTIDLIELAFICTNSKALKNLEFYNREINLNLNNELLLTEKWKNIVNVNLEGAAIANARYA